MLILSLIVSNYNMVKEYHSVCVDLMLIDNFADRMPITANIFRCVEILRTILLIFAVSCILLSAAFSSDAFELITGTVVFNFILDFDNKISK